MQIPVPEEAFRLSERVVKLLLHSYLLRFQRSSLFQFAREQGVSVFKLPVAYTEHAELLHTLTKAEAPARAGTLYHLPPEDEEKESVLLRAPRRLEETEEHSFYLNEHWKLRLQLQKRGEPLSLPGYLYKTLEGLLQGARGVFLSLRYRNPELSSLSLELKLLREEGGVKGAFLELRDSLLPEYEHPLVIGFTAVREG